ncbi:MAG: hypothetical protein HYY37_03650 [Candidatus Aenigmarchaeota archaeon]|nr:hypothetical protein [Candidatus Aenigmarchaeota archaeon]
MLRLSFRQKALITLAALGVGAAFSLLWGGAPLAVLFVLLAFDKIILGMGGILRKIGIEFTTILTIFIGVMYGPVFAFFYTLLIIPVFHAIKFFFIPMQPDWPLFVPAPYNFADAIGAALAAFMKDFFIGYIMFFVVIEKIVVYALADRLMFGKPVDIFGAVTYFVFNMAIALPAAGFLTGITGAPVIL